jgi:hypothetical protein
MCTELEIKSAFFPFNLFLFSTEPQVIREAEQAGVDGFVVDWEYIGKAERQRDADTQINRDTLEDLLRVRKSTSKTVLCRINVYHPSRIQEIEQAIEAGADEIFLPMVRTVEEVAAVLERVKERCGVGILIETVEAIELAESFSKFPLSRVYVGLNDLSIDRKTPSIFTAVLDGTVEFLRQKFSVPFGFGGLTVPESGFPIPCRLLMGEMARLGCQFSFLRRSFYRDLQGKTMAEMISRIREGLSRAFLRSAEEVEKDHLELGKTIQRLEAKGK